MECTTVCTLPAVATKQLQKYPLSFWKIDKLNLCTRRRPLKRSSISNGRPHFYRPLCSSQLASELAPVASAAYGVLLLGGGLFAYSRSGSKGSLLGGLTGAGLMGTAYVLMQASETTKIGEALAFGSALLFASVFGIRLVATRKIIPAGPLLALSISALALFISAYLQEAV